MEPELTPEQLAKAQAVLADFDETVEKDPSFLSRVASDIGTGLTEAPGQIVRGAQEGVNAALKGTDAMARWLNENVIDLGQIKFGSEASNGVIGWAPGMPEQAPGFKDSQMPAKAESVTGGFVNDVSQFLVGLGVAGKALKAVGVSSAVTAPGVIAQGMAKGAIADAGFFDAHEERLSNLIEQYPRLSNPVTDYLAADPTDSEAEGRFKNAVEGLFIGGVVDSLLHGIRAIRANRAGDTKGAQEALDELEKTGPKVDEQPLREEPEGTPLEMTVKKRPDDPEGAATAPKEGEEQLDLGLEGGGARPDSPRETFGDAEGNVKPGDAAADIPGKKASPDDAEFKPAKKLVEVDDTKLRELVEASINEKAFGQGRNISGIRTDLLEGEGDINSLMSGLRVVYREQYAKTVGGNAEGVRSWENVQRNADSLADIIGEDPRVLMQRMTAIHKEVKHADAEMLLYRDMLVTVNDRLEKIAEIVADPLGGLGKYGSRAEAYADFAKHYELMANMQLMYKGIQTSFARTMNAMKLTASARKGVLPADVSDLFEGGARQMEKMARRIVSNKGNVKGNAKLTRGGFVRKFMNSVNEYWINSILSGPKTHVVNVISGLANTAFMPAEKMIAGALHFETPQGREMLIEGGLQYFTMAASLRDAVSMAYKAFKKGDAVLDPGRGTVEHPPQITAPNYNISDPGVGMAVNGLGALVRLPSRFLTAEDEFLKQLTYRSAVRASALREGLANGLAVKPKELGELIARRLDESVDADGAALNLAARDMAREVTFTGELKASTWNGGRSWGETFQSIGSAHPGFRLIMPFVRTPTNIMRYVWNRTPVLNLTRKQYVDDIMGVNGPSAQAKAHAQMVTGAALWGAAISHVMEGNITGAGPADPDIRKAMEGTGWRPYSIRVEQEDGTTAYRPYGRMDPFGSFFGLVADFTEAAGAWPERDLEERAAMVAIAVAKNLNNKSYLTGLVNAIGAMNEPGRKMDNFFKGLAGGFVPNILSQAVNQDENLREARSIVDAMRRKMPGLSEGLDPQRNVLGEKQYIPPGWGPDWMSPITDTIHPGSQQPMTPEWKITPQRDVYDELARQMFIHNSAIKPAPEKVEGVDLTKYQASTGYTAADRYAELAGTVKIKGQTMKEALSDLINSETYKTRMSDGTYDMNGSRIDALRATVQTYRAAALNQLRQEIPDLHWAIVDAKQKEALQKLAPEVREQRRSTLPQRPVQ